MKKIILLSLVLNITLFAHISVKEILFESGISIYGKVGFVNLTMEEDDIKNTYKMKVVASSTGLVKALTNNRKDIFISEGYIKNGVYIPRKFTKETLKTNYKKITTYLFNYEKDIVVKKRIITEKETIKNLDIISMKINTIQKTKITENYTKNIELFANDFLSLYLNMQKGNIKKGKVNYVDMNPKDTLILVNKKKIEVYKHNGKEKYNIEIYYDKDSIFFKKIISIDIAFYGDAYIKKIYEKTSSINN